MRVYLGQTRAAGWMRLLDSYGFGEMAVRQLPRRRPFAWDNGAFGDWSWAGHPIPMLRQHFREDLFAAQLVRLIAADVRPDLFVIPDLVAAGAESLAFSRSWIERVPPISPRYLVVQDGMGEEVRGELQSFDGLFVGGSLPWKLKTGADWVAMAHAAGRHCHIGRVGTTNRVRWARRIGADSIDSSLPLFSLGNWRRFLAGFEDPSSLTLFA